MQQWIGVRGRVEITGLKPKIEVGDKRDAGDDLLSETNEFNGKQRPPSGGEDRRKNHHERGKQAPDTACIKAPEAERLRVQFVENDLGYQKARDNKEYVDTDEASWKNLRKGVKSDYRQDGDSTQSIDIGPIMAARGVP